MNKIRANEIVRKTFYYSDFVSIYVSTKSKYQPAKLAFDVGRYFGMMQKNLEEELEKEIKEENSWIPCSERLPEVPKGIDDEECPEFNVTINGAEVATTLKHSWDGKWFDDHGNLYDVIAWQPLPESYNPKGDN